jgi:hypothetical protein
MTHKIIIEFVKKLISQKIEARRSPAHLIESELRMRANEEIEGYNKALFCNIVDELVSSGKLVRGESPNETWVAFQKNNNLY